MEKEETQTVYTFQRFKRELFDPTEWVLILVAVLLLGLLGAVLSEGAEDRGPKFTATNGRCVNPGPVYLKAEITVPINWCPGAVEFVYGDGTAHWAMVEDCDKREFYPSHYPKKYGCGTFKAKFKIWEKGYIGDRDEPMGESYLTVEVRCPERE